MLRATRDPARGPTRRHRQIEREDAMPPAVLRAGFDVQSLTAGTSDPVRMATRVALTPRGDPLTLRKGCRAPGKMLSSGSIQACRPGPLPCRSIRPVRTKRERHT